MPNDVPGLLSEFYKRPNCQAYAKPAKQIELLSEYLWFRQVLPTLTLEAFLDGYAKVADADTENCKDPAVALSTALPRRKPKDQPTLQVFSAEQHLAALAAYIEGVRYLDTIQQPVPVTFYEFLKLPDTQTKLRDGSFLPKKGEQVKPKEVVPPPTVAGTRSIYTDATGREQRGRVISVDLETELADFEADSGELYLATPLTKLTVCEDPSPRKNLDENGQPAARVVNRSEKVGKVWWARYNDWIGTRAPIGIVPEGEEIHVFTKKMGDGVSAIVGVRNHVPPVIDARLVQDSDDAETGPVIVCELPPRENLLGEYRFPYKDAVFVYRIELES